MRDWWRACRVFRLAPAWSFGTIIMLAVGVGIPAAVLLITRELIVNPIGASQPDRIISSSRFAFSYPDFQWCADRATSMDTMGAFLNLNVNLKTPAGAEEIRAAFVSDRYFDVLKVSPLVGRLPGAGDTAPTVVISQRLWEKHFFGDAALVGRSVLVNDVSVPVVAVLPAQVRGTTLETIPELWLPLSTAPTFNPMLARANAMTNRNMPWLTVIGRRRADVPAIAALDELSGLGKQLTREFPKPFPWSVTFQSATATALPEDVRTGVRRGLYAMNAIGGLVAALITINLAILFSLHALSRRRDLAIRMSSGASRWQAARVLLDQVVIVGLCGGLLSSLVASAYLRLAQGLHLERAISVDPDIGLTVSDGAGLVLIAIALLAILSAPIVLRNTRMADDLLRATAPDARHSRWLDLAVSLQVAVCVALLVPALSLLESFRQYLHIDPGVDPSGVLLVEINLGLTHYTEPGARVAVDRVLEQVRALPGVDAASLAANVPLGARRFLTPLLGAEASTLATGKQLRVFNNVVDRDYFKALGIRFVSGTTFSPQDAHEVVINQTLARTLWRSDDPVGRTITLAGRAGPHVLHVAGVVIDGKYSYLNEDPQPYLYLSQTAEYAPSFTLIVKSRRERTDLLRGIREVLTTTIPDAPMGLVQTFETHLSLAQARPRTLAFNAAVYVAVAMLLIGAGIYICLAHYVRSRTRELGVRLALGESPAGVIRSILRRGAILLGVGGAAGLLLAVAATRLMAAPVLAAAQPGAWLFVSAALCVIATGLLAMFLPARSASRVDPATTLKAI